MMFGKRFFAGFATVLLLSSSCFASEIKTIYIDIVGAGTFEVIYHRALSNATGVVIGGLVGAGIQSGIEAGLDTGKAQQLSPLIAGDTWKTRFLDTLNDKLQAEGYQAVWVNSSKEIGDGVVLKIYPAQYGFRLVDTTTNMVSAFVAFKASFWKGKPKSNQKSQKEEYYITDKNQHTFDDLLVEGSPANSELESTLEKAARRLANKIIYRMRE